MSERDQLIAERKKLKQRYGAVFEKVSAILFEIDLVGINFETNTDEYDPEVGTILPRLMNCESETDVCRVIFEEFSVWFGKDEVGSESDYADAGRRVWEVWRSSRSS